MGRILKKGDCVELCRVSHWGGRVCSGKTGILLKRTYLAYRNDNCRWDVLVDGTVINLKEVTLRLRGSPV